jgi:hypothetical protein
MANEDQVVPQPAGGQPGGVAPAPGDVGPIVTKAWNLAKDNAVLFILGYLVTYLMMLVSSITIVLPMCFMFGFVAILQKRYKGEPAAVGDVFQGFQKLGKAAILTLLLIVVGIVLLIPIVVLNFIPCIGQIAALALILLVAPAFYFVVPMAVLSDVAPMDCIKKSFEFFKANFAPVLVLTLVTAVISWVGALACGIGILFTVPMGLMMMVIAYNEYYLPKTGSAA